jgi:hypothetical protein
MAQFPLAYRALVMALRIPFIKAIYIKRVCTLQIADHIFICEFVKANYTKLRVRSAYDTCKQAFRAKVIPTYQTTCVGKVTWFFIFLSCLARHLENGSDSTSRPILSFRVALTRSLLIRTIVVVAGVTNLRLSACCLSNTIWLFRQLAKGQSHISAGT